MMAVWVGVAAQSKSRKTWVYFRGRTNKDGSPPACEGRREIRGSAWLFVSEQLESRAAGLEAQLWHQLAGGPWANLRP